MRGAQEGCSIGRFYAADPNLAFDRALLCKPGRGTVPDRRGQPAGRGWPDTTPLQFESALNDYRHWYRDSRLKAFMGGDGRTRYEAISGRKKRLCLRA